MTKKLHETTMERIENKAIWNKYWTVVRNMTVCKFHHTLTMRDDELNKYYGFNQWQGYTIVDAQMAIAHLFLDDENISVTRYKRLVA